MTSKSSISFEERLYQRTALRYAAYVHVLLPTSVLSRKLKRHHCRLEHLNKTSSKLQKCTDQQRSAIVKRIVKCFSCLPLSLTHALGLSRH